MTTTTTTQSGDAPSAATVSAPSTTSPAAATPAGAPAAASGTAPETPAPSPTPTPPAEPARVVPETYTLTVPEGQLLDQEDVEAIAALAKTKQWTNEEAQAALEETHTQLHAQRTALHARLVADAEVGGTHTEAAQQAAFRVIDRFLPASEAEGAEFRSFLNKTGYGDWPPIVRLLSRVGKAMGEDTVVSRGVVSATTGPLTDRQVGDQLYPTTRQAS